MRDKALEWIEKQIRKTRISIGHAEEKSNAAEELTCLYGKLEMLEWLSQKVLAAGEE